MDEINDLGVVLRQQLDALIGWLHQIPFAYLLLIAILACLAAFALLISRVRAGRRYRRVRDERDSLKQEMAALQATYDSEVSWRTASEAPRAAEVLNIEKRPPGTDSPARS